MQRYTGIEMNKKGKKVELRTVQKERLMSKVGKIKEFKEEQEAFDYFYDLVKEHEEKEEEFVKKINKMKFFHTEEKISVFVESEEKIKEKRIRLEDVKIEDVEKWIEEIDGMGISKEERENLKKHLKKIEKNKKYRIEIEEINKTLLVITDDVMAEGLLHEINHLEIYDIHKGLEDFEEAMSVIGIEGYDEYVMKGWKSSQTFSNLYSHIVSNEKEYYEAIKELAKMELQKINMGIYGYHTKCRPLMELDEWHEIFESDLLNHELYDDEYENGEYVQYIRPEWYFGDVSFKPKKEEYPCNLILNVQMEREEEGKFFWVSI